MEENDNSIKALSIIFIILGFIAMALTATFFYGGLQANIQGNDGQRVIYLTLFVIFDVLTIITTIVDLIPSLLKILKVRTRYHIILFILSLILFVAAIVLFGFVGKIIN